MAHRLADVLPVPTGTTVVSEAGQFATEVRSLLHAANGAHGVFEVGVYLNLNRDMIIFRQVDDKKKV